MKKIILILLLITFNFSLAQNGWERVNVPTTNYNLVTDIKFYNNIGLMSTFDVNNSYLQISTDGGLNWFISADSIKNVTKISKVNNTIWLGCDFDAPYRSTNGGLNFTRCGNGMPVPSGFGTINVTGNAFKIFTACNVNGAGSNAYYSTNNGSNWIPIDTIPQLTSDLSFKECYAEDSLIIIVTGTKLLRSFNNGKTWESYRDSSFAWYGFDDRQDIINIGNKLYLPFAYADYRSLLLSSTSSGANWHTEIKNYLPFNFDIHNLRAYKDYIFFYNGIGRMWYGKDNDSVWKNINTNIVFDNALFAGNYIYIFEYSTRYVYRKPVEDVIGIKHIGSTVPDKFYLEQNYPNPFNPVTNIEFSLPQKSFVRLKVFDLLGREVSSLVNLNLSAGKYNYDFNASALPSGIYFYKLETENFSETKKMMLVK